MIFWESPMSTFSMSGDRFSSHTMPRTKLYDSVVNSSLTMIVVDKHPYFVYGMEWPCLYYVDVKIGEHQLSKLDPIRESPVTNQYRGLQQSSSGLAGSSINITISPYLEIWTRFLWLHWNKRSNFSAINNQNIQILNIFCFCLCALISGHRCISVLVSGAE